MPTMNRKALDVTNSCPVCDATARRDEALLDALQTVRFILSNRDGIKDPRIQLARIKAAVDEALKLMQPRRW